MKGLEKIEGLVKRMQQENRRPMVLLMPKKRENELLASFPEFLSTKIGEIKSVLGIPVFLLEVPEIVLMSGVNLHIGGDGKTPVDEISYAYCISESGKCFEIASRTRIGFFGTKLTVGITTASLEKQISKKLEEN